MSEQQTQSTEWFNGLLLIAAGIGIWWHTAGFPLSDEGYPGPSLFPRMIAAGFALCGLLLLITQRRLPHFGAFGPPGRRVLVLSGGILLVLFFPWLIGLIGFIPGLGVLCFGFGLLLRVVWWKAALAAVLTAAVIYLLFVNGLGVSL